MASAQAAIMTGTFTLLDKAWYQNYDRKGFHVINDNDNWLQMDKAGHVWTTYQYSNLFTQLWRGVGLNRRQSTLVGTSSGLASQLLLEILDGRSSEWGFSLGDMAANIVGATFFAVQELLWQDQRIQMKLGYIPVDYSEPVLNERANKLFGHGFAQRILKDYNAQTYWASMNVRAFVPKSKVPKWLNVAFGYGASGMYGARHNTWQDAEGVLHERNEIPRRRHFYLSPDLSLSRISVKNKWLHYLLYVLDMVKVPLPTLEYRQDGTWFFRPI